MGTSIVLAVLALAQATKAGPAAASGLSADPGPIPVSGIVLDGAGGSSGRPVADADVWLFGPAAPGDGRRAGMELWWSNLTPASERAPGALVHARTDSGGKFTVELPAEIVAQRSPPPLVIWAATGGPERRLAVARLPRIVLADDPPVRLELAPAARAEVTVVGPDQKPVAGGRVVPTRSGEINIPAPLGSALAAHSDKSGRVVLEGLSGQAIGEVQIEAPGFGTQVVQVPDAGIAAGRMPESSNGRITVTLAPVGRLTGRLMAPGDEPIAGVTVHARTKVGGYAASGTAGLASAGCDAQGRFSIDSIAHGALTLTLEYEPEKSTTLRGEPPKRMVIAAGETTDCTFPLRQTVKVNGLVREKGTNQPIGGVKIILNGHLGGDRFAVTGADGRFAGSIIRELNQPFGWPVRISAPFYYPTDEAETPQGMPQRGNALLALPPITLPRGIDFGGTVAGENNKGVAGATVEAVWTSADGMAQAALQRTNKSGSFTFHGIDPLAEVSLTAWDSFASSDRPLAVRAEAARTRPVALTISPKNSAPLVGRVVDPAGRAVAGASIRIWREVQNKEGRAIVVDPVASEDGNWTLRSHADGRYRTPVRVPRRHTYYVEASAPERLSARSAQITPSGPSQDLPVLVLRRVSTVSGIVVDGTGNPVPGAIVRQSGDGPLPTQTKSGEDGRFRLPGCLEGTVFLVAEKPGFRFHFQAIGRDGAPIQLVLTRTADPPPVFYRTLPPALPVDEEKALALRLLEGAATKILEHGNDEHKFRFLIGADAIDPNFVLERIESIKFSDPDMQKAVRGNLTTAMAAEHLDEAIALIEASPDPDQRASAYVDVCGSRRDLARDRLTELLTQAMLNARNVKSADRRSMLYGNIADRWLDMGEREKARTLLDEAIELGRTASKTTKGRGFELGIVAQTLARIDLPAALKVLDDLTLDVKKNDTRDRSYVFERIHGRIAYNLAAQAPADAERVLGRIPRSSDADRFIYLACAKMAPEDLVRARRIAETRISAGAAAYGPYALGLMAGALADSDKPKAIRLLDDAYAELEKIAASGRRQPHPEITEIAAALLPIAEQIEPDRLGEFLGRALALRPPKGDQTDLLETSVAGTTAALAMVVALYDRKLAGQLLEPELQKTGTYAGLFGSDYVSWRVLAAQALFDPQRAVAAVQALPDDPGSGTDPSATKNQARMQVATLLALHGKARWQHICQNFLYLSTADTRPY